MIVRPIFRHLAFWHPALRVLCYHNVHSNGRDRSTVTTEQLDAQLGYCIRCGFNFIRASDLISKARLPERPLLLTFDDGYIGNLEFAQPVLRRHCARATIFVVTGHVGDRARWDKNGAPLLSVQQLRELDPAVFELALHSHGHLGFDKLSLDEIEDDLKSSLKFFRDHDISFTPALAYPYGSRPKRSMPELAQRLTALGIPLAFRLGNRVNRLPIVNAHEIQRIDVNGERSDAAFRRRLWLGKLL